MTFLGEKNMLMRVGMLRTKAGLSQFRCTHEPTA